MKTPHHLGSLFTGLATLLFHNSALAKDAPLFEDMIVFGDSLSDQGNLSALLGGAIPQAPYFEGQYSNGPVYIGHLDDLLSFEASRELNFAVAGALSGPGTTVSDLGNDHTEGNRFNGLLNGNGSDKQIERFLATDRKISASDLVILNIGGNDYLEFDPAVDDRTAVTSATVGQIAQQVDQLIDAGAKQLVVPLVFDISITDYVRKKGPEFVAATAAVAKTHNQALIGELEKRIKAGETQIYVVDVITLFANIRENAAQYGFTNITDECYTGPSEGGPAPICDDPNSYLFFDSVHPSAPGHRLIALAFADTITAPRLPGATAEISTQLATDFDLFLNDTAQQTHNLLAEDQWAWFGEIGYVDHKRDTQATTTGYKSDGEAIKIGAFRQAGRYKVGLAASYAQVETDYDLKKGEIETNSLSLGAFVQRKGRDVSATIAVSTSVDDHDLQRNLNELQFTPTATTKGHTFALSGELRAHVMKNTPETLRATPFIRARWQNTEVDGYSEAGAPGLNRMVSEVDISPFTMEIGADIGGHSGKFHYAAEITWVENLTNDAQSYESALASLPTLPVTITTQGNDDSHARISGTVGVDVFEHLRLSIGGRTTLNKDSSRDSAAFVRFTGAF